MADQSKLKEPDADIEWVLGDIEEQVRMAKMWEHEFGKPCLEEYRRHETVFRRLAREAGYDLSKLTN